LQSLATTGSGEQPAPNPATSMFPSDHDARCLWDARIFEGMDSKRRPHQQPENLEPRRKVEWRKQDSTTMVNSDHDATVREPTCNPA